MPSAFDALSPAYASLSYAQDHIDSGWLVQYRSSGLVSDWIRMVGTGAPHSHSAMTRKNHDATIDVLEVREFRGGQIRSLEWHAKRYSGRMDFFRPNWRGCWNEWDPQTAVAVMRSLCDREYGYWNILTLAARKMPLVWRMFSVDTTDVLSLNWRSVRPHCSHAVALATQIAGADVVPRKPNYLVEPGDLTQSLFYSYEFSL